MGFRPVLLQVNTQRARRATDHIHNAAVELARADNLTIEDVKMIARAMKGVQLAVIRATQKASGPGEEPADFGNINADPSVGTSSIIVDSAGNAALPGGAA